MKRREFINWAGLGLIASCLPVALVACSDDNTSETNNSKTEKIADSISIGTITQLETDGFLLDEEAKVMVVKDSQDKLVALNPTCTHQGCTVDWDRESQTLICPCHYAKFATDGKVLSKPAPLPLPTYGLTENNCEILVTKA